MKTHNSYALGIKPPGAVLNSPMDGDLVIAKVGEDEIIGYFRDGQIVSMGKKYDVNSLLITDMVRKRSYASET